MSCSQAALLRILCFRLELLDADSLTNLAKEGKVLVGQEEGNNDKAAWLISASLIVEKGVATGKAHQVR